MEAAETVKQSSHQRHYQRHKAAFLHTEVRERKGLPPTATDIELWRGIIAAYREGESFPAT